MTDKNKYGDFSRFCEKCKSVTVHMSYATGVFCSVCTSKPEVCPCCRVTSASVLSVLREVELCIAENKSQLANGQTDEASKPWLRGYINGLETAALCLKGQEKAREE